MRGTLAIKVYENRGNLDKQHDFYIKLLHLRAGASRCPSRLQGKARRSNRMQEFSANRAPGGQRLRDLLLGVASGISLHAAIR
jgi:hypothetical protein